MHVKEFWSKVTHVNPDVISSFQQPWIVFDPEPLRRYRSACIIVPVALGISPMS